MVKSSAKETAFLSNKDYINIRQILGNLYYDVDAFLKQIKKVEVRNA